MEIRRREIARYLGYKGTEPDTVISALIEECVSELTACVRPRSVWEKFPLRLTPPNRIRVGLLDFESSGLTRNLKGCESVILFAATLGTAADAALRRASTRDMTRGVIMQAAAAEMIEAYCDEVQQDIREKAAGEGTFLRPRFSPGYGDCPLSLQKNITLMLNTPRQIGLTVTENDLLIPIKSVTAFIGVSRYDTHCIKHGCDTCEKIDCAFRL